MPFSPVHTAKIPLALKVDFVVYHNIMSFLQRINTFRSKSNFDETRWVNQILRTLDEELGCGEEEAHVCIFNVPKALMCNNHDSYIPQEVSIGPYHHWRPELCEVERYKIAAAKYYQKQLENIKFQDLVVQHLMKYEPRIRACYHKYLDISGETLSLMMAIDSSFLLEFLHVYACEAADSSRLAHIVNYAGMKAAHNAILRDIMMLENQIPLFVLRRMLEFQHQSLELADDLLQSMLMGLCSDLCPIIMTLDVPIIELSECSHLLDFMYQMLMPRLEAEPEICIEANELDHKEPMQEKKESFASPSYVKQLMSEIWKMLSKLNKGPVRTLKKPFAVIGKLPWKIISKVPGASLLKLPIIYLFFSHDKEANKDSSSTYRREPKPPLIEEITIPSVTELSKCGVRFVPSNGGISSINFDANAVTFYLPTVCLDVNTEVIFRNLVAYEASIAFGPLVITRYTELMNGIIDTEEDARILRENGIILNHLKSDLEVANLWNGMSRSVRLTRVPFLDKVVEDVNEYYNGRWKVKLKKTMKFYVYSSWRFLTVLATILMLLLTCLQTFCSVYTCRHVAHSLSGTSD